MNKKQKKEILEFMDKIEREAPILIPTFKWSFKTYKRIFDKFIVKGNTITGSNEGIRW